MVTAAPDPPDQSVPADPPLRGDVLLWNLTSHADDALVTAPTTRRGRLTGIAPIDETTGEGGLRIELFDERRGAQAIGARLPLGCALPLSVGDEIESRVSSSVRGIHAYTDQCLTDSKGRLMIASVESGDVSYAPGFDVAVGDFASDASARDDGFARAVLCRLLLSCGGKTAHVTGSWRMLSTDEGRFWLTGRAFRLGPGALRPDAVCSSAFAIVRVNS